MINATIIESRKLPNILMLDFLYMQYVEVIASQMLAGSSFVRSMDSGKSENAK
jgi:hypothetical protein